MKSNFDKVTESVVKEKMGLTNCPVSIVMQFIGGKWKPIILFLLLNNINRFGVISRKIEGINKQMLTQQLRELERDKLIIRTVFPEVPLA